METVLTAKEYEEASDHNHTQILFNEWIKGAGKDAEAKREKVAKELVDAREDKKLIRSRPRKHPSTRPDRFLISHEPLRCFQESTNRNPSERKRRIQGHPSFGGGGSYKTGSRLWFGFRK